MIEFISVRKSFGRVEALRDVSLVVQPGTITAFLGPNGAGKTTSMRIATGISLPDAGDVKVCGHSIVTDQYEAKKALGYLPDMPMLQEYLSGADYLNFIMDIYDVPGEGRREMAEGYLERFDLSGAAGELVETYSLGMKRKLSFIAAMCHAPRAIFLDEPTLGLDPAAIAEMRKVLRDAAKNGAAIMFSTHILEMAEKLCDTAVIIDKGSVLAGGAIDELRKKASGGEKDSLEEIFLKLTEKGE